MKCLVLGGKGFIGSHLVDALIADGHTVRVFDRPNLRLLNDCDSIANIEWHDGDFNNVADLTMALAGCDVCYHLISTTLPQSSNSDPTFDAETNLIGTLKLLDLAVVAGIQKIVFISSGGTVYGIPRCLPIDEDHPTNPICAYGITKLAIEKYLGLYHRLYGLEYVVLRLSNPFGERQRTHASQGVVAVFMGKVLRREKVEIWGDGSVVRDYIHISDVVEAMVAALDYSGSDRVINIGSGCGIPLNDVLAAIEKASGLQADKIYKESRPFDVHASVLAVERAAAVLRWKPRTPFIAGLERMATWLMRETVDRA